MVLRSEKGTLNSQVWLRLSKAEAKGRRHGPAKVDDEGFCRSMAMPLPPYSQNSLVIPCNAIVHRVSGPCGTAIRVYVKDWPA